LRDLSEHLLALETELQNAAVRGSEGRLCELLAPDFREFGRSGRAYTRFSTLSSLALETHTDKTEIEDFAVARLSDTIALATYRGIRFTIGGDRLYTNRSSIWRLDEDDNWRMVFHQGTPAA
jgi:hypothetical protein